MELKKEIRILGRRFEVEPRAKESLKGITVGEKLSYRFYDGTYQVEKPLNFDPFGHARFAHLFVLYD